jgi:cytochrome c oxidase subunit II
MQSFDPVTPQGLAITNLFWFELILIALLLTLVLAWIILALTRFRARPGDATEPPQVHGNRRVEIAWTATPALVLAVIFVLVVQTMRTVDAQQADAQRVHVIGHQWWWEFQYPDQQVITANELHVPVGLPLAVDLDSIDVIHSFWIPQMGWMRDAIPGKTNQIQVLFDRAGVFQGACTQYCGLQHAWMRIRVVADPPDQYQTWLQQQRQTVSMTGAHGEQVFLQNTCVNCHAIRGLPAPAQVGPDLTHFGSRATLGAGVVDNTPDNLRRWIRDPKTFKPGVLMPAFSNISDADLDALVQYLESLQ